MQISSPIAALSDDMKAWRRQIHSRPEIAFQETGTAAFVADLLRSFGIQTHAGIGRTGVVGVIDGNGEPGPTIALRADMDALPIQEEGRPFYRSVHRGLFHGCGHDGHTAILLGAAKLLAGHRQFKGRVVLVFQPAEEIVKGSQAMLDDQLLERFPFDEIYGLHNHPQLQPGKIGVRVGSQLAAVDFFSIEIRGTGSHGGTPHRSVDPIAIGALLVTALQTVVSRSIDPLDSAALSICQFVAGATANVIPDRASLQGTTRALSPTARECLHRRLREICDGVALAHGCAIALDISHGTPPTINADAPARCVMQAAGAVVGAANVLTDVEPLMAGDDVARFLEARPGCYFFLGQGGHMCHHPEYDFNDDVAPIGVAIFDEVVRLRLGV
ncbi:amidohydrolase [Burkholderia sp. Bp9126]|nr:amidohydrolase [Burkholderia sp. Bp9126]